MEYFPLFEFSFKILFQKRKLFCCRLDFCLVMSSISIAIEPNVFDQDFDCRFSIKLLRLRFLQDFCPRLRLKNKVLDRNEDHFDSLFFCTNFRESVGKLFCKCNYYGGKSSFKLPVICKSPFRWENLCSPEIICRMKAPYFLTAFSKGNEIQHMKSKSKTFIRRTKKETSNFNGTN